MQVRTVLLLREGLFLKIGKIKIQEITEDEWKMKNWQQLIGMIIIAISIIISGVLIAQAIQDAGCNIHNGISYMGEVLR